MNGTTNRPVVVGVDGSATGLHAVRWAAAHARRHGTYLRLVHACEVVPTGYPSGIVDGRMLREAMTEQGRTWLAEATEAASAAAPGLRTESAIEVAASVPTLVRESRGAALVVLGSRGLGGFTGLLAGSTSVELAAHGQCPVVVVRDGDAASGADGPVVVGVDGTVAGESAIAFAFAEASAEGTGLVAVHAWMDLAVETAIAGAAPALDFAPLAEQAETTLSERLAGSRERYPDVPVTREVVREHPTQALLRLAEHARLVVVGSRGRGGFTGLLLGSTSQHLLRHAPCPVAVVRTDF